MKTSSSQELIRVVYIADIDYLIESFTQIMHEASDMMLVGLFNSGLKAIDNIVDLQPDVIVISSGLADISRYTLLYKLQMIVPKSVFIMSTLSNPPEFMWLNLLAQVYFSITESLVASDVQGTIRNAYQRWKPIIDSIQTPEIETIKLVTVDANAEDTQQMKVWAKSHARLKLLSQYRTGTHALQGCRNLKPDVVLIATNLSDMSDANLMQKIRDIHPNCAFVNVSRPIKRSFRYQQDWMITIMKVGNPLFLFKPFVEIDFHATIEYAYYRDRRIKTLAD